MGLILKKDDQGFERVVLGEVLIPDVPNVYGDIHTRENVREFAYWYMANTRNWYWDLNHDGEDVEDRVIMVESFIAREGDPDFIDGAWVLGAWIRDDDIWQQILDGELNGYSWEALVAALPVELTLPVQRVVTGRTEPAIEDRHEHSFFVVLDNEGRVVIGGTSIDDGHSHPVRSHTFTEVADDHTHIYNVVTANG